MKRTTILNKKSYLLIILLIGLALGSFMFTVKASPYDFAEEVDQLKEKVSNSPIECWRWPSECRKDWMIHKLDRLMELIFDEKYSWAYLKLLYDIKPKLTGLKTDENEENWGFFSFYWAWIDCEALKEEFRLDCNRLLSHLKLGAEYDDDISAPFISITYSGSGTINDPGTWHIVVEDPESGIAGIQILVDGEEKYNNQALAGILEFTYDESVPIVVGEHTITVNAVNNDNDGENDEESATESEWVDIIGDTIPPSINNPADIEYEIGSIGNSISWIVADENPDTFTILLDGSSFGSGTWESGIPIEIIADGLSIGVHEFLISVYDTYDNYIEDVVLVNVIDTTPGEEPADETPPTISINYAGEYHTDDPGIWTVNVEDLESGLYEVQIIVFNATGYIEYTFTDQNILGIPSISYDINVPAIEGTHTIEVTAINAGQLVYTTSDWVDIQPPPPEPPGPPPGPPPIDATPPSISINYVGEYHTENPGYWNVYIEDQESGLDEVSIVVFNSTGYVEYTFLDQNLNGISSKSYDVDVPPILGTHTIEITAVNFDQYADTTSLWVIIDPPPSPEPPPIPPPPGEEPGDETPPTISINYAGEFHTDDPGIWTVNVEDLESGLYEVQIIVFNATGYIEYTFTDQNILGIPSISYDINVPAIEGTHTIQVTAMNPGQFAYTTSHWVEIFPPPPDPGPPPIIG
ncbi:MAG: hypothetical protein ACFFA3_14630 [Promethearchaeota archaeon]